MRIIFLVLTVCGSPMVLAQTTGFTAALRTDPPSSGLDQKFSEGWRARVSPDGDQEFINRFVVDNAKLSYFGYEILLEEQQPGTYLATFGKLTVSPLELSSMGPPGSNVQPQRQGERTEWTMQPPRAIPEPRVVHAGDTISVNLFVDPMTGEKLIDDIRIESSRASLPFVRPGTRSVSTTFAGTARDFSAIDAELQIGRPRVTLNGVPQDTTTRGVAIARGSLVWFYLPNRGRYILSLAPRPELDFKLAGEVRGNTITFTWGGDSIKLECPNPATGDAAYHLYVLLDPEWEPTARAQKGQFAVGSVAAGELASLKRK
jgi:hypothetical protein